jgi:hypothetical protein
MGACETLSASHVHPGNKPAGAPTPSKPLNQQALSSLPILGRRLPASSSFVLTGALPGARLRALQLDPDRAPARNPAAASKSHNNRHPPPGSRREVTGPDQYALLTARAPMGAVLFLRSSHQFGRSPMLMCLGCALTTRGASTAPRVGVSLAGARTGCDRRDIRDNRGPWGVSRLPREPRSVRKPRDERCDI